ncbi:MAG: inosine/xanthosine triphosphatase [Haloferacaceae archaeon]
MRVAVGSGNPVKREAVAMAIESDADGFGDGAVVDPVAVDSGVSEQPTGHRETRTGAEIRAERAYDAGAYDLGVGIEGGVAGFPDRGGDGGATPFLVMWAAATDGDRTGVGAGPSIALPAAIAARIDGGEELGPVMDEILGASDVAKNQGAAGVFTAGRIDRAEALSAAVAGALAPFVCSLYD